MNRQTVLLGGLVGLLILVAFYFLGLAPAMNEVNELEAQIEAEQDQQLALQATIRRLKEVRAEAPAFESRLAAAAAVLPSDPRMPGALRQLQVAADDAGVRLDLVGSTRKGTLAAEGPGARLAVVEMTLQMRGSYFQMVDFLRRLEDPRLTARGMSWRLLQLDLDEYPTLNGSLSAELYYTTEGPVDAEAGAESADGAAASTAAASSSATGSTASDEDESLE